MGLIDKLGINGGDELVFIAELGTCYEGNVDVARLLLERAKASGADVAKLDCFCTEDVYRLNAMAGQTIRYSTAQGDVVENRLEHVRRKSMTMEEYREIFEHAQSIDLLCFGTVYTVEMMRELAELGMEAVKISSPNIIHLPLICEAGKLGLALFIDTNYALLPEVAEAVYTARDAGIEPVVMHNPPGRPTPAESHNFRVMVSYKEIFRVPIGFACHYQGDEMLYTAVALGANVVEKPVSRDPKQKDFEHIYALHVDELPAVIRKCRNIRQSMGKQLLAPTDRPRYVADRMSPCAKRQIEAGECLTLENVTFKRPCGVLSVKDWPALEGRVTARRIDAEELVDFSHLAPIHDDSSPNYQ